MKTRKELEEDKSWWKTVALFAFIFVFIYFFFWVVNINEIKRLESQLSEYQPIHGLIIYCDGSIASYPPVSCETLKFIKRENPDCWFYTKDFEFINVEKDCEVIE